MVRGPGARSARPGYGFLPPSQTDSQLEVFLMTRSIRSWLRAVAGATPARRRSFVPRLCVLEDRTLPSVQFTPAPYAVPANRPDTPLGPLSFEPYLSVNAAD